MIPCNPLSESQEVISAIDGELAYQNSIIGTSRAGTKDHGVAGQVLSVEEYANKARNSWVMNGDEDGDRAALDNLRKCAAICVRALMLYGCPTRN